MIVSFGAWLSCRYAQLAAIPVFLPAPDRNSAAKFASTTHMRSLRTFAGPSSDARSIIFIRVAVGLIFFTQGILKYLDPHMGLMRFERIGFPMPNFTAHFVGAFEIVCGLMVLAGLLTRLASIPLLIVILTAIATTKLPELAHQGQGFWFMVSDARTDFAITMSLLFLLSVGGGPWSLDARIWAAKK